MALGGNKSGASGFAALGSGDKDKPTPSIFGEKKPSLPADPSGSTVSFGNNTSFGSGSTTFGIRSDFGSPDNASTFGKPSAPASREDTMDDDTGTSDTASTVKPTDTPKRVFGLGAGGFKLGSTFKGDGSAKDDLPKPKNPGASLFGQDFGKTLGDTSKSSSNPGAAWLSGSSTPSVGDVKKEPDSEEDAPKLKDIPPAAPPRTGEKKAAPVDDAPLPPDPATYKPKPGALPAPIPPGFGADFGKAKDKQEPAPQDAPLPPAFGSTKKDDKSASEAPVAGSPPVDLGHEKFSEGVPSDAEGDGPPEDDEEWSDEEGEGEDEEENEEDEEGEEESEDEHGTPEVTDAKGLSAFEARLTPASPKRGEAKSLGQGQSTTPATDKKESYTPAGLPPAPVMFHPPQRKGPQSPRSPSPVRSATSPLRPLPSFGASQPPSAPLAGQSALRLPSSQKPLTQLQQPASRSISQAQTPQRIAVPPAQLQPKQPERPVEPTKPSEPEAGQLEDEEDARIQKILSAPIEPTIEVPAFLAHQDYIASGGEKAGLGGQIERVFRDINSMIDTLALNARALQGFVAGNARPTNAKDKGRYELEDEESWTLGEASELSRIVGGIEIELQDGKLEDVRGALETLREEEKEVAKLRARSADARKRIQAKKDPEQLSQQANAALPVETQTLQAELRHGAQKVQTLLSKAEELLSVLRAELASQPQAKGKSADGINGAGVPTVEAVEKTIRKMTKMIEERSGDVDVLEAKIRRLSPNALNALKDSNAANEDGVDDLAASLKATQISKPTTAPSLRASRVSAYGSPVAARRSRREGTPGTADSAAWKGSLMDVSSEEIEAYRIKKDARRRAMDRLRETLESRGARVVRLGEN
jgi:nucleoporin NUP159